jgi:DNA replication and repair protein RecF
LGESGRVLFPRGEEIRLRYLGSPEEAMEGDPADYQEALREALNGQRQRELGLGYTVNGPHRDDLVAEFQGNDLRRYGSAGQVRAAMVSLKLAKLSLLQEKHGESPLFLMDDFDTELDEARARALAAHLHEGEFQALVATSKDEMVDRLGVPFGRIRMVDGTVQNGP